MTLILTVAFLVTHELMLSTNGNLLLVKLQEENVNPKTQGPEGIDYMTTQKPHVNVPMNQNTTCTLENQCVRVYDPDKKISMNDNLFSSGPQELAYKCCYRYWYNGYYYCNWNEYWCKYWWGK